MSSSWCWSESGMDVTRSICTSPPGCHGGCGILLKCRAGKLVGAEGDPSNPFSCGRLCPRGLAIPSALADPSRLTTPLSRVGPRGSNSWEPLSWEKACERAASMLCEARDASGPGSVAFCKGTGRDIGPYLSALSFGFGSPNYFAFGPGTGSACLMPRMAASNCMLGDFVVADCSQFFPDRYDDPRWRLPACILVWGSNPMWSNPDGFLGAWIAACAARGSTLMVVDPRKTWLAARAGIHLQLRPGTDGALALAMIRVILASGMSDRQFIDRWVSGLEPLGERVEAWTCSTASDICGLPEESIRRAAHVFAEARPASIHWGVSVDMSGSAMGTACALIALMAITGNVEKPGGNVVARDPSGIPRRGSAVPPSPSLGEEKWPLLRRASPYAHADALLDALEKGGEYRRGGIGAAWIQGTNTFVSSFAQPARALDLLRRIPSIVVVDPFLSPTAVAMADLVIPPAMFPERDGIRNWWYMLATINKAVEPPGGIPSDMEIVLETGRKVAPGAFPWRSVREWFDSILAPSGHSFESLREAGWAMPGIEYGRHETGRLREDGKPGFRTPSGRIELRSSVLESLGYDPLPWYSEPAIGPRSRPDLARDYPFVLVTGARSPVLFHSENRTVRPLRERNPDPLVEMHSTAAASCGIEEGDRVSVESPWGACERFVRVDDSHRPDTVGVQHGWWLPERQIGYPGLEPSALSLNVNNLFPEGLQAESGMGYPFRSLLCRVVRLGPGAGFTGHDGPDPEPIPAPAGLELKATECCGCLACEVACLQRSGREGGPSGISVRRTGPGSFTPSFTSLCDGCVDRPSGPFCAANCPSGCLEIR